MWTVLFGSLQFRMPLCFPVLACVFESPLLPLSTVVPVSRGFFTPLRGRGAYCDR